MLQFQRLKARPSTLAFLLLLQPLLALLATMPVHAEEELPQLAISIRATKELYSVGDPIVIECTVRNTGLKNYTYNSSDRDATFKTFPNIQLTAEYQGKVVPDPKRNGDHAYGGGSEGGILPLNSQTSNIRLNRWATLTKPGTYRVTAFLPTGHYDEDSNSEIKINSPAILIILRPRTPEQMSAYIAGVKKKLSHRMELQGKVYNNKATEAERDEFYAGPQDKVLCEFTHQPEDEYIQELMFTHDPSLVPTFINLLYALGEGHDFWITEGLLNYFHYDATWKALLNTAQERGLAPGMNEIFQRWFAKRSFETTDPLSKEQWNRIISRSLAPDNPGCWKQGIMAAKSHPDDSFTKRLVALALDPKYSARQPAIAALMANRTDESVQALHKLLKDPKHEIVDWTKRDILSAYRDSAHPKGRPYRDSDFDESLLPPLKKRLLTHPVIPPTPTNLNGDKLAFPAKYSVSASFDKPKYFLGENVQVKYCLTNTGSKAFAIDTGGDYRFSPRHTRFEIKAVDDHGVTAADPHPNPMCEGGLGGQYTMPPGKKFEDSVPLMSYCRIQHPGKYEISVSYDAGWTPAGKQALTAKTQVTFVMPTDTEARHVVDHLGQTDDFTTLSYPIYLPILLERVHKGPDAQAIQAISGIGSIATPEATQALIDIARGNNNVHAKEAVSQLVMRLPDPRWEGKLPGRNPFEHTYDDERKWLVSHSWKPQFAGALTAIAKPLLESSNKEERARGAFILECLGNQSDVQSLVGALDQALEKTKTLPFEKQVYPRPRGSVAELIRAAVMQVKRSGTANPEPKSPGEAALFLLAVSNNANFRPQGWQDKFAKYMNSDIPYLRELAIISLPTPVPPALEQKINTLIKDSNVDVQIAACEFAQKHPLPIYTKAVLEVAKTAKEEWLLRSAINALSVSDEKGETLTIIASRLGEEGISNELFSMLMTSCFDVSSYGGSYTLDAGQCARIKPHWLELLKSKKQAFANGERLKITDPAFNHNLLPTGLDIYRRDGTKLTIR